MTTTATTDVETTVVSTETTQTIPVFGKQFNVPISTLPKTVLNVQRQTLTIRATDNQRNSPFQ